MAFQDFPRFPGKSGRYEIHPPKLCASLPRCVAAEDEGMQAAPRCAEICVRCGSATFEFNRALPRVGSLFLFSVRCVAETRPAHMSPCPKVSKSTNEGKVS